MTSDYLRDVAFTINIFAFASTVWFGWAMDKPPRRLLPWVITGLSLGYVTLATGIAMTVRHWNDGTVIDDVVGPHFGIVVGIEAILATAGVILLQVRRRRELVPPWVALIVGLHFFPTAVVLHYPWIHVPGVLVAVAALAAVPIARRTSIGIPVVTGLGAGLGLIIGAWGALIHLLIA